MKHKHHIVPKYAGGTDDKTNLIELSVEEHALEHKKLYEKYGRWQDYLAWKGLLKLISKQELVAQLLKEAAKKGALISNSKRKGMKYKPREGSLGLGTSGLKWYHNPENPTQKGCFILNQEPKNWVRGQGRKSKNPGLNFTAPLRRARN